MGMTFFFAAANVYYRDVAHILQVVLSAWFYVTPIIYSIDMIPEHYRWILKLNPIIYVINGFRLSVYYGQLPKAPSIIASFVCAFVSLFIGFALIQEVSGNICLLRLSLPMSYDSPVIRLENVTQRFRVIHERPDTMRELFSRMFRHNASFHDFEAVKNASLEIPRGQAAGHCRAQRFGQEHAAEDHCRRL